MKFEQPVHVVVLRGAGPIFSSGVDLKELAGQSDPSALRPDTKKGAVRRTTPCSSRSANGMARRWWSTLR